MNELTLFDYAALPVNDAMELSAIKERIKIRLKRTAEDIIEIGLDLIEAKRIAGHGGFEKWLTAEFEMGLSSAKRFIQVAEKLGGKSPNLGDLKPSAIYLLAQDSTPEEVRTEIIERIEDGETINSAEIQRLKKENAELAQKASLSERDNEELHQQLELVEANHQSFKDSEKARIKQAAEELAKEAAEEAKTNKRLFDESVEQTKRIVEEDNKRIETLEKTLTKERKAKELEIEQARKDGEQSAIDTKQAELTEIERRIEQNTQKLEKTKAEADKLSASINLESCSGRVTQSIYYSMLSISAQFGEFELELSEEQRDVASDQMIATWEKIAKQFRAGCAEVDGIVAQLKDKAPARLRVV